MAEDAEKTDDDAEGAGKSKKKLIGIVGGALGIVILAFVTTQAMAPKPPEYKQFAGDYVTPVTPTKITTNLRGGGGKRFLAVQMQANFEAYDEVYITERVADPVYMARIKDAVLAVSSRRTVDEVSDDTMRSILREELRRAVGPIMFPVHVGDAALPTELDSDSGIGPGDSLYASTYRTPLYDGKLFVDAPSGTLRLDDGAEYRFTGEETDLRVEDGAGKYVFLDLTELDPEFRGQVMIGTHGRVRELLFEDLVIQ
ncbi:MAG: flagellar basal body-associated FliL family protein [Planctomycetota bacterium]